MPADQTVSSSSRQAGITGITYLTGTLFQPAQIGMKVKPASAYADGTEEKFDALIDEWLKEGAGVQSHWYSDEALMFSPDKIRNVAEKIRQEFATYGALIIQKLVGEGYQVEFTNASPALVIAQEHAIELPAFDVFKDNIMCATGRVRITSGNNERYPKIWMSFAAPVTQEAQPTSPTVQHFVEMASGFSVALMAPVGALVQKHFEDIYRAEYPDITIRLNPYRNLDIALVDSTANGIGMLVDDAMCGRSPYGDKCASQAVAQLDDIIKSVTAFCATESARPLYDVVMGNRTNLKDGSYAVGTLGYPNDVHGLYAMRDKGITTRFVGIVNYYSNPTFQVNWPGGRKPTASARAAESLMLSLERRLLRPGLRQIRRHNDEECCCE